MHSQMVKGRGQQVNQNKECNHSVIKKKSFNLFFMKKNWAVPENFQEIINFYQELGDQ